MQKKYLRAGQGSFVYDSTAWVVLSHSCAVTAISQLLSEGCLRGTATPIDGGD